MEPLRATVVRDLGLVSVQAWQRGYEVELKRSLGWRYPILFHYDGARVHFYHRLADFSYFKETVAHRLVEDRALLGKLNQRFLRDLEDLRRLARDITGETFPTIVTTIGRAMSFYMFIVSDAFVRAVPEAWPSRRTSEGLLYDVDAQIESILAKSLVAQKHPPRLAHVLTVAEARSALAAEPIEFTSILPRLEHYTLWGSELIVGKDFATFCREQGFSYRVEAERATDPSVIAGSPAFPGRTRGRVVIVHTKDDLAKVQAGDIVVSIMTNATYTSVLAQAGAIVTDEGGVTCHAAILARELRIPCVVGAAHATQVLSDGSEVEVDAKKGVIKILKR